VLSALPLHFHSTAQQLVVGNAFLFMNSSTHDSHMIHHQGSSKVPGLSNVPLVAAAAASAAPTVAVSCMPQGVLQATRYWALGGMQ
jgi:hypothetical protein